MTQETLQRDDIDYLVMALALNGICVNRYSAELILKNWERIQDKGGEFSIKDSCEIEMAMRMKYRKIEDINPNQNPNI